MIRKSLMLLLFLKAGLSHGQAIKIFYDSAGNIVDESKSFYFTLVNEKTSRRDTIKSFYTSTGNPRSYIPINGKGMKDGLSFFYHENGQVKGKAFYRLGSLDGNVETWYSTGQPQSIEFFDSETSRPQRSFLLQYWDSLGRQIIKDGEGFCSCVFGVLSGSNIVERGKLTARVRDGIWNGYRPDGSKYFEETFKDGELVNGVSFDRYGNRYSYVEPEELAVPPGGLAKLYDFISGKLKYPKSARRQGVEGKVFVEFVVDSQGYVTDVKCIKGIGAGCDEIAVDVVKSSPQWKPGKQRGQPVRQRMVLPIDFKLG